MLLKIEFILLFLFFLNPCFSQSKDKDEEYLLKNIALQEERINAQRTFMEDLDRKNHNLAGEIDEVKKEMEEFKKKLEDTNNNIYRLLWALGLTCLFFTLPVRQWWSNFRSNQSK